MDTEEMIRAQPMDAVVLIGGCDKTLPAQMMAAASVDLPAIVLPTGPMLVGHYDGHRGDDPGAADGRSGADRRLRQDAAGADDGRRERRPAGDRAADRPDAGRALQRREARRGHPLPGGG